jgi:hypothetical protein
LATLYFAKTLSAKCQATRVITEAVAAWLSVAESVAMVLVALAAVAMMAMVTAVAMVAVMAVVVVLGTVVASAVVAAAEQPLGRLRATLYQHPSQAKSSATSAKRAHVLKM